MPVNFQQIYRRVREIAEGAHESKKILEERRKRARELLAFYASELDFLRKKVDQAKESDINLRCAGPFTDSLASFCPPPASIADATIIAADGSQRSEEHTSELQSRVDISDAVFCFENTGLGRRDVHKLHDARGRALAVRRARE